MFTRGFVGQQAVRARIPGCTGSLLEVGRSGASRTEWIFEAVQELRSSTHVQRIGVWMEEPGGALTDSAAVTFRGEVWDEGIGNVLEWTKLVVDAPLRIPTLQAGLNCEYEVREPADGRVVAPELQMRHVLWAPVMVRRTLRGLVMLGTVDKKRSLPAGDAERVAESLGVLLELEDERRLATARKADLDFCMRMKRLLLERQSPNMILGQLAESCTRGEPNGGVGAVFTLIGERKPGPAAAAGGTAREDHLLVRAQSGDATWVHAVNNGPLEPIWRRALTNREVACTEVNPLPLAKELSRLVAIPIECTNDIAGVLLAGLPKPRATLEALDRMVLRSALAGEVFEQEQRVQEGLVERLWRKAFIESREEPVVLLDRYGTVVAMSKGTHELLREQHELFAEDRSTTRFAELFQPRHWERVQHWIDNGPENSNEDTVTLESQLCGATPMVLRRMLTSDPEFVTIAIERPGQAQGAAGTATDFDILQRAIGWLEEGVVVFGVDGRVIARNATLLQLLGISDEAGKKLANFEDLLQAASCNAAEPARFAAKWRALSGSCTEGMREELAMQAPVAQTIERYARPMIGPGGKQLGRVEVYRGRHTWQVVEAKMAQAEHLVSLGLRVTAIVHELNNPLTTILGKAQRLAQREGDGESSEAEQIVHEAERATAIVRQLLTLPHATQFEKQPVSLNELVESVVETLRGSLTGSRVRLKAQLQEGLPWVQGDREQLQQVLLNLLHNAVQAMEDSGHGSSLMVRTQSVAAGRIRLEVQDDGPGIPESLQRRIFDPFFTTKPPGKGTGLGLAIVKAFVRDHRGTIALHSRAGEGARFVVELPGAEKPEHTQSETDSAALESPIAAAGPEGANRLRFKEKGPRVLVVEDEPTVANLIQEVLHDQGMETAVFTNAGQALEAAQDSRYDLAICDVHMPEMDGPLFFSALRQANSPLQERILFVTGDEVAQRTSEFLAEHQLPYVTKPFRIEELCSAVRKMLDDQRQSAEPLGVDLQ